jgi:hypothetical protein
MFSSFFFLKANRSSGGGIYFDGYYSSVFNLKVLYLLILFFFFILYFCRMLQLQISRPVELVVVFFILAGLHRFSWQSMSAHSGM